MPRERESAAMSGTKTGKNATAVVSSNASRPPRTEAFAERVKNFHLVTQDMLNFSNELKELDSAKQKIRTLEDTLAQERQENESRKRELESKETALDLLTQHFKKDLARVDQEKKTVEKRLKEAEKELTASIAQKEQDAKNHMAREQAKEKNLRDLKTKLDFTETRLDQDRTGLYELRRAIGLLESDENLFVAACLTRKALICLDQKYLRN
jgi:chromosome segregation ATPase